MRYLFIFTLAYLAAAILVMAIFREDWITLLQGVVIRSWVFFQILQSWLIYAAVAVIILIVSVGVQTMKLRMNSIILAVLICALFPSAFSVVKTSLPYIVPFYADPYLADFDYWLHFGNDPWRIAWKAAPYLLHEALISSYIFVWSIPALFFPILLAASDGDTARVNRFLIMYVVAWVVIGNFFALAGMSVGPVYYDRFLGGARFAELIQSLRDMQIANSIFGEVQENLWRMYTEEAQSIGSGISAFPSVHISSTVVTVLYMIERSRWFVLPALVFFLYVFFIAVFTGFHYAVDGYFSVAVVVALWAWLRSRRPAEYVEISSGHD